LVSDRGFCDVPVHSVSEKLHDGPKRELKHREHEHIMFACDLYASYDASGCGFVGDDDARFCVLATCSSISFAWSMWS
jgi:hypothetical protein